MFHWQNAAKSNSCFKSLNWLNHHETVMFIQFLCLPNSAYIIYIYNNNNNNTDNDNNDNNNNSNNDLKNENNNDNDNDYK